MNTMKPGVYTSLKAQKLYYAGSVPTTIAIIGKSADTFTEVGNISESKFQTNTYYTKVGDNYTLAETFSASATYFTITLGHPVGKLDEDTFNSDIFYLYDEGRSAYIKQTQYNANAEYYSKGPELKPLLITNQRELLQAYGEPKEDNKALLAAWEILKQSNSVLFIAVNPEETFATEVTNIINTLTDSENYQFEFIIIPEYEGEITEGVHTYTINLALKNLAEQRGDCFAILSLAATADVGDKETTNTVCGFTYSLDSEFSVVVYPHQEHEFPFFTNKIALPATVAFITKVCENDKSGNTWDSPAGFVRGRVSNSRPIRPISQADRSNLSEAGVTPILIYRGQGPVIFDDRTTLNVIEGEIDDRTTFSIMRMVVKIQKDVDLITRPYLFSKITPKMFHKWEVEVSSYLANIQRKDGLSEFKVTMDESNNDAVSEGNSEVNGIIQLRATKNARVINLNFAITPTGIVFN